jgi:hypothetical protein
MIKELGPKNRVHNQILCRSKRPRTQLSELLESGVSPSSELEEHKWRTEKVVKNTLGPRAQEQGG